MLANPTDLIDSRLWLQRCDAHDPCDAEKLIASSCSAKPSSSLSLAPTLLVCESRHRVSVAFTSIVTMRRPVVPRTCCLILPWPIP